MLGQRQDIRGVRESCGGVSRPAQSTAPTPASACASTCFSCGRSDGVGVGASPRSRRVIFSGSDLNVQESAGGGKRADACSVCFMLFQLSSFCSDARAQEQKQYRDAFKFLDFKGKVDLTNPSNQFSIFIDVPFGTQTPINFYFARLVCVAPVFLHCARSRLASVLRRFRSRRSSPPNTH